MFCKESKPFLVIEINNLFMMQASSQKMVWATNMKNNLENIISFDALYESMMRCKKGVIWKDSVASYRLNAIERTLKLATDLQTGKYKSRPPAHFQVLSPKPRDIVSISFRDRVYQRSANDNEIYPVMTKSFIWDNFACQRGKGTDAARQRLKVFLWRHFRRFGPEGWVAQFDISGYYPNMGHAMAESVFRRKLRPEVADIVIRVLREQYEGTTGYNPGSQLVQIAGISVLDRMDHMVKERLRAKSYLRYMDDFLIIHPDRAYLEQCHAAIVEYLASIGFVLNPKKSRIYELKEGIEFLGFTFCLTDTGKVLMQLKSKNVKAQRRKLFRLVKRNKLGLIPRNKVDESYTAWRNHASKGNSFHLVQRMDAFYKSLWKEEHDGCDR